MAEETNGVANFHEAEEESQAQEDIWKCICGFTEMAVVKCAIELGISDFLENHQEPITLNQLSSALGCSASNNYLYRIMRFLINRGIFKEVFIGHGEMGYVQTPVSRLLRRDGQNSMAALVLLESSPVMLAPWHYLSARILEKENTATFSAAHGKNVWEYAKTNPEHSKLINDALACHARVTVRVIIDNCAEIFKGIESLVDVGGGNGTTLGMLVKAFPWISGINFDLPHVVSVAPHCHGVVHVEGDMFDSVPNAQAAFLMVVNCCNLQIRKLSMYFHPERIASLFFDSTAPRTPRPNTNPPNSAFEDWEFSLSLSSPATLSPHLYPQSDWSN
ncbi:hypothetical protein HAX54_050316 [Datura stramonium]|uniref:Uncharacterized protein n=1 Tax=Datura stramonium TaxID=4076 RepID=A0ABS8SWY8_DATST|nr:hypothetical protein [Datura stramonium]